MRRNYYVLLLLSLSLTLVAPAALPECFPGASIFAQSEAADASSKSSDAAKEETPSSDSDDISKSADSDSSTSGDSDTDTESLDAKGSNAKGSELANLEALLNICANAMEIWGIACVGNYLFGAIVAFIEKHFLMGGILLALCPISFVGGLATPGIVNWIIESSHSRVETSGVLGIIMPVILTSLIAASGFFPAVYAFFRRHPQKWLIFGATFIAWFVPFGWPAMLFWALYTPADEKAPG